MRQRRNRIKLIASAITLAAVLVAAGIVQRNHQTLVTTEGEQTRSRSVSDTRTTYQPPAPVNPAKEQKSSEADIRAFLERWRLTLLRGDVKAHAALYAPTVARYFRDSYVNREQITRDKRRLLKTWPQLRKYDISGIRVESASASTAVVTFRKDWDARARNRRFAGAEKERLTLAKSGGEWEITSEEELKVYRVARR